MNLFDRLFDKLLLYDKDDGTGSGDNGSSGNDQTDPTGRIDADPAGETGDQKVTFTPDQQEAIDGIMGKVRRDTSEKAVKALLKNLGFDDESSLKSALDAWKKSQEQEKTETERLQGQIEEANNRVTQAETERDQALTKARQMLLKAEINRIAVQQAFADPGDVLQFLDLDPLLESWDDDRETFDVKMIQKAVEKIGEDKPYLIQTDNSKSVKGSPRGRQIRRDRSQESDLKVNVQF